SALPAGQWEVATEVEKEDRRRMPACRGRFAAKSLCALSARGARTPSTASYRSTLFQAGSARNHRRIDDASRFGSNARRTILDYLPVWFVGHAFPSASLFPGLTYQAARSAMVISYQ